jgi:hypothetical protein
MANGCFLRPLYEAGRQHLPIDLIGDDRTVPAVTTMASNHFGDLWSRTSTLPVR